jgi:hypothetical protein
VLAGDSVDPMSVTEDEVDRKLAPLAPECYDGLTHRHMFALPRRLRDAMVGVGRVISDEDTLAVRI